MFKELFNSIYSKLLSLSLSRNLTGAGLGMKSINNRNFEAGILTDEKDIVAQAINQFDKVWIGQYCGKCGRKDFCELPISKLI